MLLSCNVVDMDKNKMDKNKIYLMTLCHLIYNVDVADDNQFSQHTKVQCSLCCCIILSTSFVVKI